MSRRQKQYILQGLDCANCAQKIENQTKRLPYIQTATVNFAQCKLTVEYKEEEDVTNREKELKQFVASVESGVDLRSVADIGTNRPEEKDDLHVSLLIILFGVLLFVATQFTPVSGWLQVFLYFLAYVVVGFQVLKSAGKNMIKGQVFDENFLMSIATIGALAIGEYPEAIAVMLFYRIGEYFQARAVNHSRKSIAALLDLKPTVITMVSEKGEEEVLPEQVAVGSIIRVKPGERIALDGVIIEGSSALDLSAITGESTPKMVAVDDEVLGGAINGTGVLTIRVTAPYEDGTLAKILHLVEEATNRKTKTENFITKFAHIYTPVVVGIAIILAILPPLLVESAIFSDWFYRALVFLVISCPCALVISIPLSYFAGIGALSKNGILVKSSHILEELTQTDTVVFDKTGTLTKGAFRVQAIYPSGDANELKLLELAAYAEIHSTHPIAKSIVQDYEKAVDTDRIANYEEKAGYGISVLLDGKPLLAGNMKLMSAEQIFVQACEDVGTVVYVAYDGQFIGSILIGDEVKKDAKQAMQKLRESGVEKLVMLTGDNAQIGEKIAQQLQLDAVYAELLPQDKLMHIEKILAQKSPTGRLVFVGDGINDTPALARADIGIAMGGIGTDAAMEVADLVIMYDEPTKISTAIKIARFTKKIVWQNIIFAIGMKLVFLGFGALGIATLWEAVFADVGVTILAVLNALRILQK